MSFTNFGLIKRSSAAEIESTKEHIIEKSQTQPTNLLPLVNTGEKVVFAPQPQINKEHHHNKKAKEEMPKEPIPSGFVPEQ
jgi:hypothetical protein